MYGKLSSPRSVFFRNATLLNIKYINHAYVTDDWWEDLAATVASFSAAYPKTLFEGQDDLQSTENVPKRTLDSIWTQQDVIVEPPTVHDNRDAIDEEIKGYKKIGKSPAFVSLYKENQLGFWAAHQIKFPVLSRFAKFVLSAQATEAEAERLFSLAGRMLVASRAALSDSTLCALVFVKMNTESIRDFAIIKEESSHSEAEEDAEIIEYVHIDDDHDLNDEESDTLSEVLLGQAAETS